MKHLIVLAHAGLLAACLAFGAAAQTNLVPTHDLESWNDLQITVPINKKNDFTAQGTIRFGDNISQPVDERLGVGWVFKVHKYLSFLPSYFHREARPPNGKHETEERLTLGATLRFPVGKFTLMDRNLFEHRWRNPQVNAWRYRNRLQLEHPFRIDKTKFTLFFFDEVFHDWSLHVWPRNRFSVGVMHSFNPHLTLEVYYTRQNDGRTRPGDLNIIWTTWRVHL
jgi:Protein of unknown function (DUF2490)